MTVRRNLSIPQQATIDEMEAWYRLSTKRSVSTNVSPSRSATIRPMVLLPTPGSPMRNSGLTVLSLLPYDT